MLAISSPASYALKILAESFLASSEEAIY